jgi:hypothetical protein
MIGKTKIAAEGLYNEYTEIQVKPAIYFALLVVVLVAAPLLWWNHKTGAEGLVVADTSNYAALARQVSLDVRTVQGILNNEVVDKRVLRGLGAAPVVTLITPEIMPTNLDEAATLGNRKFNIELSGIYWIPADPIVTIDGENYKTGDLVQGHRIVEIRQTEVVFEDPLGEKVVKYFYDFLDDAKKRR